MKVVPCVSKQGQRFRRGELKAEQSLSRDCYTISTVAGESVSEGERTWSEACRSEMVR